MSESSQSPQPRAFQCPECDGRIVIPADLPPTTGPCPHCQATITSPAPVASAPVIIEEPKPLVVEARPVTAPASAPLPVPVPVPTQTIVEKFAEKALDQQAEETKSVVSKKPDKSTKRTSPAVLIIVFLLILAALGGGAYFAIKMLKPKDDAMTSPLMPPNRPTANPTLTKYIAAPTLDEKLNFVFNAEELRPKMEAFYKEHSIIETDTLAGNFSLVKLPEMDSKKGFILLAYDQPAAPAPKDQAPPKSNTNPPRTKILAFLKETEAGVKLDWEVFAQTKYRTFGKFVKTPIIGKSEVFRVIVTHTPVKNAAEAKPHVSYTLTDPAYLTDHVEISPDTKSQAGQALARLDVESSKQPGELNRTATIELTWTGDASKPQLEIKRFICWEFLNLGGKEIAEINPSN
ncbi:MAG: hypothetical protein V4727_03685 [Verrucomicrobiota bacterium]